MRVLVAGDTYYPPDVNGAAGFSQSLAEGLANRGHEVIVLVPSPDGKQSVNRRGDVEIRKVPSFLYPWHPNFRIARSLGLTRLVEAALAGTKPDIVHIQSHFVLGRRVARAAVRLNIPLVATSHFHPYNLIPQLPLVLPHWLSRWVEELAWRDLGRILRLATSVTSPSSVGADILKRAARVKSVRVISCGVDVARFHPRASDEGVQTASLVFVGRLEQEKHVDEVVCALSLMAYPATLKVIGTGTESANLKRLAAHLRVEDRVHFLGYVSDRLLAPELAACTVFCMPGTIELQSIATLEAMACGLPVIAADAGALPLLVSPGVNGFLYEPGNVEQLAVYLDMLLQDPDRCLDFGQASRSSVLEHNTGSTISAFEELYREVCSTWRGNSSGHRQQSERFDRFSCNSLK